MKIGCVILNYNDYENTAAQVERIRDFAIFHKIILVDNHSPDGSGERLAALDNDRIHTLLLKENKGYGAGNNAGIRYGCKTLGLTHLVIANPDTYFDERCVKAMATVFANHPQVGVAAATMKDGSNGSQASGWRLFSFTEELLNTGPVCRRLFRKRLNRLDERESGKKKSPDRKMVGKARREQDTGQSRKAVYVDAVHGSMLMVDGNKMMECGGYDERVFLYGEENILAWRMKKKGFSTVQLLNVSYLHDNSASISKTYESVWKRQKLRHESSLFYYREYLHINKFQEFLAKIFFAVVMGEIWFCSKVLKMRW